MGREAWKSGLRWRRTVQIPIPRGFTVVRMNRDKN